MKNILLLGDSIRQNYQEYVKTSLQGTANVYYPDDNGKFCSYTLRYLHEWVHFFFRQGVEGFDIVHFNCGLWDILRLSNEKMPFTGEREYADLLGRIVDRIRFLCPDAGIVFALTTEVIEPGFEPGADIGERRNEDIRKYNEIARTVMGRLRIEINDLWSISKKLPMEAHSDTVHFGTDIGVQGLGRQVVECLQKYC